ncbi:hypothetical protein Trydic_g5329 [Trypoxylus dichotomus]
MRFIIWGFRSTSTYWLPLLSNIYPPAIPRSKALLRKHRKLQENLELAIQGGVPSLQRDRLCSRNPPLRQPVQLDASSVKVRDLWDDNR